MVYSSLFPPGRVGSTAACVVLQVSGRLYYPCTFPFLQQPELSLGLSLELSGLQQPVLSLDMSGLQQSVLSQDMSGLQQSVLS